MNKKIDKARGKRIADARDEKGLTQLELAMRVRKRGKAVSRVTVNRWENGKPIDPSYLAPLSEALKVSEDYIVYGPKGRSLSPEAVQDIAISMTLLIEASQNRRSHITPDEMTRLIRLVTRLAAENGALSEATIRDLLGPDQ